MERVSLRRGRGLVLIMLLVAGFFGWRLYKLQIIDTDGGKIDNSTYYTTITRVKAARGDILDSNGNVLVGNRASYDLAINHYVLTSSPNPNQAIYNLVKLCQELGIEYNDHFPVTRERPFEYTLDQFNSTWQGYFQAYLPERGNLDSDITAPLLIQKLRESYDIPEEWSDEDARLVIGVRYELTLRNLTNLPIYVFIEDAADEARSAILELNVPGLNVESSTVREYYTTYASHILGFVGAMDASEWEYYKELGYSMDAHVGKSGFEQAFEEYLHGTDGWRVDKMSPDGELLESYYSVEPKAGNNVEVTIDISLQMTAEDQLAELIGELRDADDPKADGKDAQGGAVVVMEVKTGKILACASYPGYDLATFRENYAAIMEDPLKPMYNRALQAAYPPGSTYKMCTLTAAMRAGYINMADTIEDLGVFMTYAEAGNKDFMPTCLVYTSKGTTHGHINAAQALCVSCNYFFYECGDHISLEMLDSTAKGFGLGEPTGVELNENIGHRANKETKQKLYTGSDKGWFAADQVLAAIGQADNRFTPLQLCVYVCTLANKGTRFAATFLDRVVSTDYRSLVEENKPEILDILNIPNDAYLSYTQGMRLVVSNEMGTGYKVFGDYPIAVAGKTGTAETDKAGASDNGAFVCYAPYDDPQIAIAVYGEQVGKGSSMAVVARELLDIYFEVGEIGDVTTSENQVS